MVSRPKEGKSSWRQLSSAPFLGLCLKPLALRVKEARPCPPQGAPPSEVILPSTGPCLPASLLSFLFHLGFGRRTVLIMLSWIFPPGEGGKSHTLWAAGLRAHLGVTSGWMESPSGDVTLPGPSEWKPGVHPGAHRLFVPDQFSQGPLTLLTFHSRRPHPAPLSLAPSPLLCWNFSPQNGQSLHLWYTGTGDRKMASEGKG